MLKQWKAVIFILALNGKKLMIMKKLALSIAAIVVLLTACSKEQNTTLSTKENLVTYTFTAANADDPEVRSTLTNAGVFSWVEGDKIAIYNSNSTPSTPPSYVEFTVTAVDGSGNATISADAAAGAVWTNAIYPAARAAGDGDEVDYTVTSVAGPILVSQVDGQTLSFKYLGAVANIQVTDVPGTPTTLTFTANADVFGSRTFEWSAGSPVLGGEGTQATVTVPFNKSGITSVPLPQASYAGFTITVDNSNGRHLYKKTTSNTFDLSSKKLLPMPELTYSDPAYFVSINGGNQIPLVKTSSSAFSANLDSEANVSYSIYDSYNTDAIGSGTVALNEKPSEWMLFGTITNCSWDISSTAYTLKYYPCSGTAAWFYVKDVNFSESPAGLKILKSQSWTGNGVVSNVADNSTSVNNGYVAFYYDDASYGQSIKFSGIDIKNNYDVYLYTGTSPIVYVMSSGSVPTGFDYGEAHYSFIWNGSTSSTSYLRDIRTSPWGWDATYLTSDNGKLQIGGGLDSWTWSDMTYNNFTWSIENIEISDDNTYKFKFRTADEHNYWGENLINGLYGQAKKDGGEISISLTKGKYNVYANAVEPDDPDNAYINFVFVKQ